MSANLKACPFCGSCDLELPAKNTFSHHIYCKDCGAVSPKGIDTDHAITLWNSRNLRPKAGDYMPCPICGSYSVEVLLAEGAVKCMHCGGALHAKYCATVSWKFSVNNWNKRNGREIKPLPPIPTPEVK